MKGKASQEKMIRVDVDWFFTRENLEKFSDEELESILRELQEIEMASVNTQNRPYVIT